MDVAIISIAQHANPNPNGHSEFLRPQLYSSSRVVVKIPCLLSSLLRPSSILQYTLDQNRIEISLSDNVLEMVIARSALLFSRPKEALQPAEAEKSSSRRMPRPASPRRTPQRA